MKKQLIILGIVCLLIFIGLSGCEEVRSPLDNSEKKILGTWKIDINSESVESELGDYITFTSNGTLISSSGREGGDYEFKDGKLLITLYWYTDWQGVYTYEFSENYTLLSLYDI